MRGVFIFSAVALSIVAIAWFRRRPHHAAADAQPAAGVTLPAPFVHLIPVLQAPARFSLHSGDAVGTFGKVAMQLTNVWRFDQNKISPTHPFPLQTVEIQYGLVSAGVDSLTHSTELSPGESFLFHDTVFTLQNMKFSPVEGGHSDAFNAGGGTIEIATKQATREHKRCPLGEWVRLSLAEICSLQDGPSFSVWRIGANRARLAKLGDDGELRHWLSFDLGVASDDGWNFRGRNFDITTGSLEILATKVAAPQTVASSLPATDKPFWLNLQVPHTLPDGFELTTRGTEITRYGTLATNLEATKVDRTVYVYASARLYRYSKGHHEDTSTKAPSFTLFGRSYQLSVLGFRQSAVGPEIQLKLTATKLPKFSYGQPFSLQSGHAAYMGFKPDFIEGPAGEILGCLGESHRHGTTSARQPATWAWVDFDFFTQAKSFHLHLKLDDFKPGYVWLAGKHKIEFVEPYSDAGVTIQIKVGNDS